MYWSICLYDPPRISTEISSDFLKADLMEEAMLVW